MHVAAVGALLHRVDLTAAVVAVDIDPAREVVPGPAVGVAADDSTAVGVVVVLRHRRRHPTLLAADRAATRVVGVPGLPTGPAEVLAAALPNVVDLLPDVLPDVRDPESAIAAV